MKSRVLLAVTLLLGMSPFALSQVATGIPPFSSIASGPESINLGNLNMQFCVPVFSKPGRGIPLNYSLCFDNSIWYPAGVSGSQSWQPVSNWGWKGSSDRALGYVEFSSTLRHCIDPDSGLVVFYQQYIFKNFHDGFGAAHPVTAVFVEDSICGPAEYDPGTTNDDTGYTITPTGYSDTQIVDRSGKEIPQGATSVGYGSGTLIDTNGNELTATNGTFTDTLGQTALTATGGAPNNLVFTYHDSSGAPQAVTVSYLSHTVKTNFGCGGVSEYGPTQISLVDKITFPDSSYYQFTYEPTPGFAGDFTGRVASIRLPTGGTMQYTYPGGNNGIVCSDGSTAGLTRQTPDGTTTYSRSNVSGTEWSTTVQSPMSDRTVVNFQQSNNNFYETSRNIYQSQNGLLQTMYSCYNGASPSCDSTAISLPITEKSAYLTTGSHESRTDTFYNGSFTGSGLENEVDEYDLVSGSWSLLRKTITGYASLGNNIFDRPSSVTVQDGGGTTKALTNYYYDQPGTLTNTSGVPQHASISGSRGNLTQSSRWLNTTGNYLSTGLTYEDTGNILTSSDPGGHQTQFSYADNFAGGQTPNAHAYATAVTLPNTGVAHTLTSTYDINTGLVTDSGDQNGKHTAYSYDSMLRPLSINYPDGGKTAYTYYYNPPNIPSEVWTWQYLDSANHTEFHQHFDLLGRVDRSALWNADTAWEMRDLCFDADGRTNFASYSYLGPGWTVGKVCSGSGDTYSYDALGRQTKITHSDNSFVQYSYSGRAVEVADEGNGSFNPSRILQNDALGRLQTVCELSSTTLVGPGGAPTGCVDGLGNALDINGTGFLTSYGYDTLNNLTSAVQSGATRSWGYDSLSRLTSEALPEQYPNQTTYTYTADGLTQTRVRPAPNNASGNVTTTYVYDQLHRLTNVSYSGDPTNTPPSSFNYDETIGWGGAPLSNTIGRMTSSYAGGLPGIAASMFSYDEVGRVTQNWQCTPRTCGSSAYYLTSSYDKAGDLISSSNGAGVTLTSTYNNASRITNVSSSLVDANHPATLVSNVHYGPFGVISDQLGNGLLETAAYSTRGLQINSTVGRGQTTFASNTAPIGWLDTAVNSYNTLSTSLPQYGTLYATGWAADNEDGAPVARVSIDIDGNLLGDAVLGDSRPDVQSAYNHNPSYTNSGYHFTGSIGAFGVGTHTINATAYDWAGNATTLAGSKQITITSNGAPNGYFDSAYNQGDGSTTIPQGGTLVVAGWAVDSDSNPGSPVNKVEIRIDGVLWGTATLGISRPDVAAAYGRSDYTNSGWQATFNIGNTLSPGTHFVAAYAYDSLGGSAEVSNDHTITVTGANPGTPAGASGPILYSYDLNYAPDGAVLGSRDLVNGSWNYGYDAFNRLSTANGAGIGFSFDDDRFGNRWHENLTSGQGPAPHYTFDANNHISGSGIVYDALGNIINDGLGHTFTYDAENRLLSANGNTYVYDAFGKRVKNSFSSYEFLYDLDGRAITFLRASDGAWAFGEIYVGGRHLGTYSKGTTNFLHADWLGTKRASTSLSGTLSETCYQLPFGDASNCSGTSWTYQQYTDDIHDFESNTEHTHFRQLSTTQGRWLSPDPYMGSMDLTNPQSLNRYAYVENAPLSSVDPSGLCDAVIAGINMSPDGASSAQLNAFANSIGAETAFPYPNSGIRGGVRSVISQGIFGPNDATSVAAAAITAAAKDSSGPINVFTFSGGAQAFSNAIRILPRSITERINNIVYMSPGFVGDLPTSWELSTGRGGNTTQISNPSTFSPDPFIGGLTIGGYIATNCAHSANCEFPQQQQFLTTQAGNHCVDPKTFTPQNGGGSGRPGSGDTGGPFWGIGNLFDWVNLWAEGIPYVTSTIHPVK